MKQLLIFINIFCISLFSYSQETWTLDQIQDSAFKNFPLVRQYDLIELSKEYSVENISKSQLPQVGLTLIGGGISGLPEFTPNSSSFSGLQVITAGNIQQLIWSGGKVKNQKEKVKLASDLNKVQVAQAIHQLEDRVINLYYGAILLKEQRKQLTELENNLNTQLKQVESGVKNGVAFKSDLAEVKVEVLNVKQKVTDLEYVFRGCLAMLSAISGLDITTTDSLHLNQIDVYQDTLSNRSELQMFRLNRQLLAIDQKLNKASLMPSIGLLGYGVFINPGIEFGPSEIKNIMVGGLGLSWNLAGLYKHGVTNKSIDLKMNQIQVEEDVFRYQTNIKLTELKEEAKKYNALLVNDDEIISLKNSIKNFQQTKYNNGVSTLNQLLISINNENSAVQLKLVHEIQYYMVIEKIRHELGEN